jgi:hypothetical protein
MTRTVTALMCGWLGAVLPAVAHHSFSAYYFEERSITVEGVVQSFQYVNPHAILVLTVPDADGGAQTFTAEWSNPRRLATAGVLKNTLKPGDVVVVSGSPGRVAAERKLHLKGIRRPADGWRWGNPRA